MKERESYLWEDNIKTLINMGLYSKNPKTIYPIVVAMIYVFSLYFNGFVMISMLFNSPGTVLDIVRNSEGLSIYIQLSSKIAYFALSHGKLQEMLHLSKYFCNIQDFPEDLQKQLKQRSSIAVSIKNTFFYLIVSSAFIIVLGGVVIRELPFGMWIFDKGGFFYDVVWFGQLSTAPMMMFFAYTYDCLFLSLSTEAAIQFKMLGHFLKQLKSENFDPKGPKYEKLRFCVKYHNHLLKFTDSLKAYSSSVMLIEYLTMTPVICAEMYGAFDSTNIQTIIGFMIRLCTAFSQLAFFCITADFLSGETVHVSKAIYDSDWYSEPSPTITIPMSLILQRSQKEVEFTAGGLFGIHIRSLLTIGRLGWSACTVMRAIKNRT